jgi:hypothetical protein
MALGKYALHFHLPFISGVRVTAQIWYKQRVNSKPEATKLGLYISGTKMELTTYDEFKMEYFSMRREGKKCIQDSPESPNLNVIVSTPKEGGINNTRKTISRNNIHPTD